MYYTGALTLLLIIYYLIFRKGFSWNSHRSLLIILLGFLLTDIINIAGSITGQDYPLRYFTPLINQVGIVIAFREEGTRVGFNKFYDFLKVGIPSLLFFVLFGYYALDHPNLFEYISVFLGSLLITLLIILSFFRPTKWTNYLFGIAGAMALGTTGILYFFMDITALQGSYFPLMNGLYLLSEFFIVKAILDNLNSGRLKI